MGDRNGWSTGRLLRAGMLLTLAAVTAVAVTGLLRNGESLRAQDAVRQSSVLLERIGELRTAVDARGSGGPAAADVVRPRVAELAALAGPDPVHHELLRRIDPAGDVAGLRAAVDEMRRHEQIRLDRRIGEASAVARNSRWMISWVAVLCGLLVLIGGQMLVRRFTRAAAEITAAAGRARRGEPALPVTVRSPRELAELAAVCNASAAAHARARDEAKTVTAAGSAFLNAMSHEIRTPMTAVTAMTGMLLETDLDERQRELTETVHASGTALLAVVDDLLELALIETGELRLERRPFALRGCMRRAMEPVTAQAEANGLHLAGHLAAGCPERARGDEQRVRRILTAVLRQAVANTEHGAVTVTVSAQEDGDRLLVRFAVRDTGLGVASERRPDSGALLAWRLAASMGGAITTDCRPGKGTTVTVALRLETARQPERPGRSAPAGREKSLLVLIAEADLVGRRLTRRLLERRGHRVVTVTDGEAAVEAVQRDRYDLVLMGSGLPVLDGPSATGLIHAEPPRHGAPRIVAVCPGPEDHEDFVRAGVDGILTGPVDAGELERVLAAAAYADVRLAGLGPLPGPGDGESATIRACVDVMAGPDAEAADRRRLAEILHNFADRLPGLLDRMDSAAASGDTRNLARLAHSLKASSATLGANRFAARCADLEDRARHAPEASPEVLRDLHERAREVGETMETISRQLTRAS
ncbi:histidine kinase dimerization/phospho-acceptor domain-containing protein [Actinoplanes sp. NEAU-A12]|uniref:histidine kinase n=1 Tax=Actinoplanes sandaracinus TaxID=3045177 RepID=A0ABT6WBM7_9ACTN|nr:histidine kinase dimerization/phospho-acceptor domain-containing protein [Actinoplanes sandaracinus]MDI6097109.1 histidine kinase dimerization/phospho-acceptor domain-containing protein [Actinoplanes sandaracinus]